jgi:hypothetical protein
MSLAASPYTPTARAMFFTACSPRVGERQRELVPDLLIGRARDADTAGFAQRFEPRGDIDAVAENIVAVDDDVPDIDSNPEHNLLVVWNRRVALQHRALHFHGERDRIDYAGELQQRAIAGGLDDTAPVFRDRWVYQFPPVRFQRSQCADLVGSH